MEETNQQEVQSIPISQMTSMGKKGDYRIEVEDKSLFPIGLVVVIGESFVVQVIDHGSLILEMPLPRDFLKGTFVRGISEDDQFIWDQHGNQVFQGCLMEEHSPSIPQDSHLPNAKPPGLEEVHIDVPTLPCGKPKPPTERMETIKDKQTLQSWILKSHFHPGRKHWEDCHKYYQENHTSRNWMEILR